MLTADPCDAIALSTMPINDHRWPQRIRNGFRTRVEWINSYERVHAPIETFGELCALSREELRRMHGIGAGSVKMIEQVLAGYGLRLRDGAA